MYAKNTSEKIESRLLATHVTDNPNFTQACESGDGLMIMEIVEAEMKKNDLYTKGSKKLQADIIRMLKGQNRVSTSIGQNILFFVYTLVLSGDTSMAIGVPMLYPFIALTLNLIAFLLLRRCEAKIIAKALGFRLRD